MTFPRRPRAWACRVLLPGSLTPRGSPVGLAVAPPPACLRLREVLGSPGGRRPRDLWLRVGGGGPHIRCPELVPQVLCQAGQQSMPRRLRVPLCPVGRHSALPAGPLPRQVPPFGVGVGVRCGGPRISSAPTVGSPGCGWVGSAGGLASSFVGCVAPRARPSATSGGSGRLFGPVGCGAPAGAAVRAGSGPGPGPGTGRSGDDGSAGRAVGPVGGAWCRWGAGPLCVVAGRSSAPDVARAWRIRPSLGLWVWGCTVWEGQAVVVSVGVAVCACLRGPSGGAYTGPAAGRSGVPWCWRGSGWACVAAAWLLAGRGPCADATGGVRGCGLPVGLGACSLCECAVPEGCLCWVPTASVFLGLGMAPPPAGDARCPWIPVAVWCCGGCPCAARLDARSCRGLCGVPALHGAGSPVVGMALVARCWCGVATGVGGAEVDGLGDVEDVAADVRARTFVALVALVARDRGGGGNDGRGSPGGVG